MTSPWAVRRWQEILVENGYPVSVDGEFSVETFIASRELAQQIEPDKSAVQVPLPENDPKEYIKLVKASRSVDELIWHCAATPEGRDFTVDQIRSWHKKRGWSDIGYHYVVYRDGSIHEGRPVDRIGAHVRGRNTDTIGACYIGGVSRDGKQAKDTRTPEQKSAMLWLTSQIASLYDIRRISGHNEFAAKACPSFNVKTDGLGNIEGFQNGNRN